MYVRQSGGRGTTPGDGARRVVVDRKGRPVRKPLDGLRTLRAVVAAVLAMALLLTGTKASFAATVYQLEGAWVSVPATVATTSTVTADWRVSINDDSAAPQNATVQAAPVVLTAGKAKFTVLPDVCVGASAMSSDGSTLTCDLGSQKQGTSVAIRVILAVTGNSGEQVTLSAAVDNVTKALTPIPIVSPFAMDMVWNYSMGANGSVKDATGVTVKFQWTLKHAAGAEAGPNSVTFDLTVNSAQSTALMTAAGCEQFSSDYSAVGHPWSGGSHPANQMTNFVTSCTLTPNGGTATATKFKLTLTGIDYSKTNVPTNDSSGAALSPTMNAVASGEILIRIPTTAVTGQGQLSMTSNTFTSVKGATSVDPSTNNNEVSPWDDGYWANAWYPYFTNSTAGWWAGEYKVAAGTTVQATADGHMNVIAGLGYVYAYHCVILDTKYVTYAADSTTKWADKSPVVGAVTYYYTGTGVGGIVDPNSAGYNPNSFNCYNYGQSQWTTTKPADLSSIKAVLVVYPTAGLGNTQVDLAVNQVIKPVSSSKLPQDVWEWSNYGYTKTTSTDWSTWGIQAPTAPRSMNPAQMPGGGTLVSSKPAPYNVARYPFSTAGRDLLWVIGATPVVTKTASPQVVDAGDSTTYTINYTAQGDATATPTRDGFVLADTLPAGMTYVAGSSSLGEPSISGQVLTWTLNGVPVNVMQTLTFKAKTSSSVAPGTTLTNWVSATVDSVTKWASTDVRTTTNGLTTLTKVSDQAYIPNPTGTGSGSASWTVTMASDDPTPQAFTDTIDVLPYSGDGRGTSIAGTYTLSAPVTAPAGATVYYSTAAPGSISHDPADPSNGASGNPAGNTVGWTTTFTPNATAVRVIGGALLAGGTVSFTVPYLTANMHSGDTLVNVAEGRAEHTRLLMRTSAQITVATYYSVSVKKYVLVSATADPLDPASWVDANDLSTYPTYGAGQPVRYRIVATNTGGGTLSNVTVTDDKQPTLGNFVIGSLAPGESQIHEYTATYSATDPSVIVNTACVTAATPEGSAPNGVQLSCDPAGVTILNPSALTVVKSSDPADGSSVGLGSTVTYHVAFTNTGTTPARADYTDHLSSVLDDAALNAGSISLTGTDTAGVGYAWDATAKTIRVTGFVQPGTVVTLNYSVTVNATTTGDSVLRNVVVPSSTTPPDTCAVGDPLCTEHPVVAPGFTMTKSADPVSGTRVKAGDVITYTVTGTNTGNTVLNPVTVTDNLADVLDDATLLAGSPKASVGSAPTVSGTTLSWTGSLKPGEVVTISYAVTVNASVTASSLVHNVASASATPIVPDPVNPAGPGIPGTPIVPPDQETKHPVGVPGFVVTKSADPVSGSTVKAGDTVTYTVVGSNTGNTVLDPVSLTDDLSGVLDDADLVAGSPKASVGSAPVVSGTTLTWTGSLAAGQSVTVTYAVTVKQDVAKDAVLKNVVTGSATPPGGTPITPPEVITEHPVLVPGFTLSKVAIPASTTVVRAGDVITYQVTGANTGATVLTPVTITDSLADVLDNADLVAGSLSATVGAAPVLTGTTLTWTGTLPVGTNVVLSYQVKVKQTVVTGDIVRNVASASATPVYPDPTNPSGPGTPGTPIVPPDVETHHPVAGDPGFVVTKSADPVSGSVVTAGSTVTYTVTGSNTGSTVLDPVTLTDDLSDVLDNATLVPGSLNASVGNAPTLTGNTLSWTGSLPIGAHVTLTYKVTVNATVTAADRLHNVVTGVATPIVPDPTNPSGPGTPGDPIKPPQVDTEHPVGVPGFVVTKSADPVSGSTVKAGDTVTYTVVGRNTGNTVLDPVTLTDDLSGVLDDADLVAGSPKASVGSAPVVSGTTLTWTGSLAAGQSVTVTYAVTVKQDVAKDAVLKNVVTGSATPPGGTPITPPSVDTEHPVGVPGFTLTKTADPVSGTRVKAGDVITYTLTGSNTGNTALDPAAITDNLADVLDDATLVTGSPKASQGSAPIVSGTTLSWSGTLKAGESVTITYAVKVKTSVTSASLVHNVASATATPIVPDPANPSGPGVPGTPIVPPDQETQHPVGVPGFALAKTSVPGSGAQVKAGDVVTYTVTGSNTGNTELNPVVITDSLADVLDDADLVQGSVTASVGQAQVSGSTLTWTGTLQASQQVTITYKVTVKSGLALGAVLKNVAHGEATPPGGGTPIVPGDPTTEHPVAVPGFVVSKSSDPASGVFVKAGQVITYTVTGANTGNTVLDPVTLTDSLGDVLDNADLVAGSLASTLGNAPTLTGAVLSWTGALQPGEHVVLTYRVTVKSSVATGDLVHNTVQGTATPRYPDPNNPGSPGTPGDPISPPPVETQNPVTVPGFTLTKTADPASGTTVRSGQVITYTLTGTNVGNTVLDPVVITDDLSKVLPYGAVVEGSVTTTHGANPVISGTSLQWSGSLGVGSSVTITYRVKVNESVADGTLITNVAHGSATPPGSTPIVPPDPTTHHPVKGGGDPDPSMLAMTGSTVSWLSLTAGIGLVIAGFSALVLARRRRV